MVPSDYQALASVFGLLNMRAYFLDYMHYADPSTKKVPSSLWEAQLGKATVIWAPSVQNQESFVTQELLSAHVRKGGALVSVGSTTFQPAAELMNNAKVKEARRLIHVPGAALQLSAIKADLQLTADRRSLKGNNAVLLVMYVLTTMSFTQKVRLLVDATTSGLVNCVIGDSQLTNYQTVIESKGCLCFTSSKAKVFPTSVSSACTVRDCLLYLMRQELLLDVACYAQHRDFHYCYAITQLLECAQVYVFSKNSTGSKDNSNNSLVAIAACNLAAAAMAADLLDTKLYKDDDANKMWAKNCHPAIKNNILKLQQIAASANIDYGIIAARLRETTEIAKGYKPMAAV
jgi:hypothetical protein